LAEPAILSTVVILLGVVGALAPPLLCAAELQAKTSQAYDAYLDRARQAFLTRVHRGHAELPQGAGGVLSAGPALEDGIVRLPGGLVHHWVARAFVRGVTLQEAVAVSSAFASYRTVYKAIIASDMLARDGDTYRVLMRVKEGEAGISAVLQIVSTVRYVYPTARTAYAVSDSLDIREVKNPGARDERLLRAGRDSGYLWRANTFTHFIEYDHGVYVETETLGLSRQFPPLLGWIIEPIARRLGRRSVETSLLEFLAAVRKRSPRRSEARAGQRSADAAPGCCDAQVNGVRRFGQKQLVTSSLRCARADVTNAVY
jgi:hypothetical protein